MAKMGNEAKLILKLVKERMAKLRESRVMTPDESYITGYDRCFTDYETAINSVVVELEETARTPFGKF